MEFLVTHQLLDAFDSRSSHGTSALITIGNGVTYCITQKRLDELLKDVEQLNIYENDLGPLLFETTEVVYVISADITQLTSDYDVLIVPGGIAALYQKLLELCAGAYLASTNNVTDTKNIGAGLLPVRYSLYERSANIPTNITLNDAKRNVIYTTTYHNGAVYKFDQLSTNVTTLSTITDAFDLPHFIWLFMTWFYFTKIKQNEIKYLYVSELRIVYNFSGREYYTVLVLTREKPLMDYLYKYWVKMIKHLRPTSEALDYQQSWEAYVIATSTNRIYYKSMGFRKNSIFPNRLVAITFFCIHEKQYEFLKDPPQC
ncbi:unnamed protein product [Rotaria socialis]|uniref:Uncharacterized protein n=1 Tax=Rotaria socialis TaxID=392032 RepID=A0A820J4F7_9BILA|nr:unnamed protein product [Rotaria socialis]CAF4321000.1 unnamed protein product [Rotaria socialis]